MSLWVLAFFWAIAVLRERADGSVVTRWAINRAPRTEGGERP
jgi:hypothetical protein